MKKLILIITSLVLVIASVSSCGGKYDPIEPTDNDLRVVGRISGYEIYYDELRFAAVNNRQIFAETYSLSPDGGSDWLPYLEEFEQSVYEGLKYNYAVQILLKESGYSLDNESIQSAVSEDVKAIIDQCGGRSEYKKYLSDMVLTDRLLRFNISIAYATNELLLLMNDRGAFDDKVTFDIELLADASPLPSNPLHDEFFKAMSQLMSGDIYIRAESVLIPKSISDSELVAKSVLDKANSGESLSEIQKKHSDSCKYTASVDVFETDVYFEPLKSISENSYTMVQTDDGYRILKRMPYDVNYIQQNCYTIAYAYVESVFRQSVSSYASTLTIELTDFGNTMDLIKIK